METILFFLVVAVAAYTFRPKRRVMTAPSSRIVSRPIRTARPPTLPLVAALVARTIVRTRRGIGEVCRAFITEWDRAARHTMSTPAVVCLPGIDEKALVPSVEPEPVPMEPEPEPAISEARAAAIRRALVCQVPAGVVATIMGGNRSRALTLIREIAEQRPEQDAKEDSDE